MSYFDDWKEAFAASSEFAADTLNICAPHGAEELERRVREYELIVLLHSAVGDTLQYIQPLVPGLNRRTGRLLSFIGNEVSLPGSWLADKIALLRDLRAEYVATQLPLKAGEYLYGTLSGTRVLAVPHALNPQRFRPAVPHAERRVDVGVRSFKYFVLMGDIERNRIIDYFAQTEFQPPLCVDINTEKTGRLSAEGWAAFLNRCKATVATEAGTYYLERDDATMRRIVAFIQEKEGRGQAVYNRLRRSGARKLLPAWLRGAARSLLGLTATEQKCRQMAGWSNQLVTFDEIFDRFYRDYPNPVSGKCISSRHFDAVGCKTLQIMFPGDFNGILKADVHYLALSRDFSNIDDVLARFQDEACRARMVDETYNHILSAHTYGHRLRELRDQLGAS